MPERVAKQVFRWLERGVAANSHGPPSTNRTRRRINMGENGCKNAAALRIPFVHATGAFQLEYNAKDGVPVPNHRLGGRVAVDLRALGDGAVHLQRSPGHRGSERARLAGRSALLGAL